MNYETALQQNPEYPNNTAADEQSRHEDTRALAAAMVEPYLKWLGN